MSYELVSTISGMVERLAARGQSKYRSLEQRREEVRALIKVVLESDKDLDARGAVLAAAINTKEPSDPALARLQQQRDQLAAESQKLEQRLARLQAEHGNLDQTISRLQNALPSCFRAPEATPVVAAPREGETLAGAVMRVRGEIMRKQNQLAMLHVAPWPADEIRAWLYGQIAQLGKDAPRIITQDGRPKLIAPDISEFAPAGSGLMAPSGSTLRTLAALFPKQLTEFLEAQIVDAPGAIAAAERPTRIAETEREILRLERIEEALVEQALEAGIECHRRVGASAHAILGLATSPDDVLLPLLDAAE